MSHNKRVRKSENTFVFPVLGNFSLGHQCRYMDNFHFILEKKIKYYYSYFFGGGVTFNMKNGQVSRLQQLQYRFPTSEIASHMTFG